MAAITGISWADATANFWIGCTKLSAACDGCYAEASWADRYGRVQWGPHGDRSPVQAGAIVVRKMQRQSAAFIAQHGRKPCIFINSLSDFADNHKSILPEWREAVWHLARECPDVILMILTKRPQNLLRYLPADWGTGYPNVWLGTTVENQAEQRRVDALRAVPATLRFLSCEPLLGEIRPDLTGIGWVICGGESGPRARPLHPQWVCKLLDQCLAAAVPFHFKQWGEWLPVGDWYENHPVSLPLKVWDGRTWRDDDGGLIGEWVAKIGKKRAGRLLWGVEYNELPRG